MARKPPAFPLYARDWLVGTASLSLEQQGAYMRLLCHQWDDGPFEDNTTELARLVSLTPSAFRRVWRRIGDRFFPLDARGRRANTRLEQERADMEARAKERAESGHRGGVSARSKRQAQLVAQLPPKPVANEQPAVAVAVAEQKTVSGELEISGGEPPPKGRSHARTKDELPGITRRREASQGMAIIADLIPRTA